jgi:RNA polymerase sigma-70 factor (ECF subfamily)
VATRVTDLRNEGDYTTVDDRLLVLDFQAGHPEAFVEIHRRYGALARHVCRRFLVNGQDADEAFQETMIRVFQGLFRFNGQYALQPWIARIATNVSLDQIRTKARRPQLEDGTIEDHDREDPQDGPEQLIERLLERDLVISVLADLPESHRTALVLRELEGRSHKEIAERMGITPSQAKALIHRAKGSFRRTWLLKAAERSHLAGFVLAPLVWFMRATGAVRRLAERGVHVGQVVQSSTVEAVSAAANVGASAPAWSLGERAMAAGMTLLVAGGVTVGAATVARNHRNEPPGTTIERAAASVVPTPAPAPDGSTREDGRTADVAVKPDRGSHGAVHVEEPPVSEATPTTEPSPSAEPTEPTTGVDPSMTPTASPGPTTEPTIEPTPTFGPAPDWSFTMSSSSRSVERCSCATAPTLVASDSPSATSGAGTFMQVVAGAALDGAGEPTWGFYLNEWGTIDADGGVINFEFSLDSIAGEFRYGGTGTLSAIDVGNEGASTTYRFSGAFEARDGLPPAGMPIGGGAIATISVWADGTLYGGSLELLDP